MINSLNSMCFRNPGLLLGIMAKESSVNLCDDKSVNFATGNIGEEYDCFQTGKGSCIEKVVKKHKGSLADGPYQSKKESMEYDMSILASRMASRTAKAEGKPMYVSHLYHNARSEETEEAHKEWSSTLGRATVRTALELHWLHTIVFTLDKVGMRGPTWEKRSRYNKDWLEFATTAHAFKFGVLSDRLGDKLYGCESDANPLTDCGLDSGNYLSDVMAVCKAVDEAEDVYDYPLTLSHVK